MAFIRWAGVTPASAGRRMRLAATSFLVAFLGASLASTCHPRESGGLRGPDLIGESLPKQTSMVGAQIQQDNSRRPA